MLSCPYTINLCIQHREHRRWSKDDAWELKGPSCILRAQARNVSKVGRVSLSNIGISAEHIWLNSIYKDEESLINQQNSSIFRCQYNFLSAHLCCWSRLADMCQWISKYRIPFWLEHIVGFLHAQTRDNFGGMAVSCLSWMTDPIHAFGILASQRFC